jgi:hypothetical protein
MEEAPPHCKDWQADQGLVLRGTTDGLGIYSDDVSVNSGLQYRPMLIILSHLKVGIEEPD